MTRFKPLMALSTALAATLAFATPAAAQQPIDVEGSIQVCEAARGEHRIQLEAGRRYAITASSESFDTVLRLYRAGSEEMIAEDDDGGGGLNSRLNFQPTQSGEYVARVSSFSPGSVGAYRFRVEPQAPLPPVISAGARTERSQWRVFQGELSASDPADNGKHFDDYALTIARGQQAMIHLDGNGQDVMLRVFRANDRGGTPVAEDDDSGGGLNSFIFLAPDEPGDYVVRVTSYSEGVTGAYRLRIAN